MPKVLYIGNLATGSNSRALAEGFARTGAQVVTVDTSALASPPWGSPQWVARKLRKRPPATAIERVHREIEHAIGAVRPDILFCFKTILLDQPRLLAGAPSARLVHYSQDDVSNPYNTTPEYLAHESRWDVIVTTKRHNVEELRRRGVPNPHFIWSAYDPTFHHLTDETPMKPKLVGFIGALHPPSRLPLIRALGRRFPGEVRIVAPRWRTGFPIGAPGVEFSGGQFGAAYAPAVASIRANLVLLNEENRDRHTSRSLSVPACGGLFVGERTEEHQELLDEGTEALMFTGPEELSQVIERVRRCPTEVDRIARAGYRRITAGGNTFADRAAQILAHVANL